METTISHKEKSAQDSEMDLSNQISYRVGAVDSISASEDAATRRKLDFVLMPLLGFCYMLQFLDKATLSYSSLLGLPKDTVGCLHSTDQSNMVNSSYRILSVANSPG